MHPSLPRWFLLGVLLVCGSLLSGAAASARPASAVLAGISSAPLVGAGLQPRPTATVYPTAASRPAVETIPDVGPGPNATYRLPTQSNTGGLFILQDGAGVRWFAYRATSGPSRASSVLYRQNRDGSFTPVLTEQADPAYGGVTFTLQADGTALFVTVDRTGSIGNEWVIDEAFGWTRAAFLLERARLPAIIQQQAVR